jgi:uncharacterized OB-fold protein
MPPQAKDTRSSKYIPPHLREGTLLGLEAQRIKEGKCKRCGDKWDPKHRCYTRENSKNYIHVKQRKTMIHIHKNQRRKK